jgi:hypothetical protein
MKLSDLLEISALATFVLGIYWLAGRGGAAVAGAIALMVIAFALDGVDVNVRSHVALVNDWLHRKVKRGRE